MELSSFSKKVFLIFWEIKLSSTKLKKLVIFEEGTFQPQKKKKKKKKKKPHRKNFFCFKKWKFLASSLENSYIFSKNKFSYISRGNLQSLKKKISYTFRNETF